jgi:hypothetical protein
MPFAAHWKVFLKFHIQFTYTIFSVQNEEISKHCNRKSLRNTKLFTLLDWGRTCTCMCISMYGDIHAHINVCGDIHVHINVWRHGICTCISMYGDIYVHTCQCMATYMYISICGDIHVHINVCRHTCRHTNVWRHGTCTYR